MSRHEQNAAAAAGSPRFQASGMRACLTLAGCTALTAPAYAYLDPGTGSILLQSALAGIAVAIGVVRLYWHRFRNAVANLFGKAPTAERAEIADVPPDSNPQ